MRGLGGCGLVRLRSAFYAENAEVVVQRFLRNGAWLPRRVYRRDLDCAHLCTNDFRGHIELARVLRTFLRSSCVRVPGEICTKKRGQLLATCVFIAFTWDENEV